MACFLSVTFLPLRPLLSSPFFIAFISVSTSLLAAGEYLLLDAFFAVFFVAAVLVAIIVLLDFQSLDEPVPLRSRNTPMP
jgi:hypothetical protein